MSIGKLFEKNIGTYFYYAPSHAQFDLEQWELGILKSFDNDKKVAWLVYPGSNDAKKHHWQEYTAAATDYKDLYRMVNATLREVTITPEGAKT